jgi:predicted O-methyltransferase YrrM
VNLPELHQKVSEELKKGLVGPRVLLDRLRVPVEAYRKSIEYQDQTYAPFFYYLGKFTSPRALFQIGLGLGFPICCFLASCKSVEKVFALEPEDEFYSPRLAISNIRDFHRKEIDFHMGAISDAEFLKKYEVAEWDMAIINVKISLDLHRNYLDLAWQKMPLDGLIIVDYLSSYQPAHESFMTFSKVVNREPVLFHTRNGIGMIQK